MFDPENHAIYGIDRPASPRLVAPTDSPSREEQLDLDTSAPSWMVSRGSPAWGQALHTMRRGSPHDFRKLVRTFEITANDDPSQARKPAGDLRDKLLCAVLQPRAERSRPRSQCELRGAMASRCTDCDSAPANEVRSAVPVLKHCLWQARPPRFSPPRRSISCSSYGVRPILAAHPGLPASGDRPHLKSVSACLSRSRLGTPKLLPHAPTVLAVDLRARTGPGCAIFCFGAIRFAVVSPDEQLATDPE